MVVFHSTIIATEVVLAVMIILVAFLVTMPWGLVLSPRSLPGAIDAIIFSCQTKIIMILLLKLGGGSGGYGESHGEECCSVFLPWGYQLVFPIVARRRVHLSHVGPIPLTSFRNVERVVTVIVVIIIFCFDHSLAWGASSRSFRRHFLMRMMRPRPASPLILETQLTSPQAHVKSLFSARDETTAENAKILFHPHLSVLCPHKPSFACPNSRDILIDHGYHQVCEEVNECSLFEFSSRTRQRPEENQCKRCSQSGHYFESKDFNA
mmetsp:Transcript_14784/g.31286  ORF Transcript_14784/g.31286 Transcript_14784/m.31286 type:complete len:265 (+) Transcript_14784:484-1278(+)